MDAETDNLVIERNFPLLASKTWEMLQMDIDSYDTSVYTVVSVAGGLNGFEEIVVDNIQMVDGACGAIGENTAF